MGAAWLQREQSLRGINAYPQPNRASASIHQIVRCGREPPIWLTRQHEHAMGADAARAARHVRQIIDNADAETVAASDEAIVRIGEQGFGLVVVDRLDRIGSETNADAGGASRRPSAPQPRELRGRARAAATGGKHGKA